MKQHLRALTQSWKAPLLKYIFTCYLVIVSTEVFEVSKANVTQTDHDGDDKNHKGEHGCESHKPWEKEKHTTQQVSSLLPGALL